MQCHRIESLAMDATATISEMYIPHAAEFRCEQGRLANADWVAIGVSRIIENTQMAIVPSKPLGSCDYLFPYPHWSVAGGAIYVFRIEPRAVPLGAAPKETAIKD